MKNNIPLFSIAIPTFNNEATIESALKSALNQSYTEKYEVVVINNCSTDNTKNILDSYNDRIRIITNNHTVTMYENHNLCLKHAKGRYIVFCHADDMLLKDSLLKYHNIIIERNYPERYVLWGRSMFRDYFKNWNKGAGALNEIASGITSINVFLNGGITPSGTCYSRQSFLGINGFINTKHRLAPSDWITMWKLAVNYFEFEMADRIFFVRKSASTATKLMTKEEFYAVCETISSFIEDCPQEKLKYIIAYFNQIKIKNPILLYSLFKNKIIDKSRLTRNIARIILFNSLIFRKKGYRNFFFLLIKKENA